MSIAAQDDSNSDRGVRIGIAVVERDGCILVGIRGPDQVLPGLHEFPGGKCHPGETPEDCTARECLEETGLSIEIVDLLYQTSHDYPHGRVELHFFHCRVRDDRGGPLLGNFTWVQTSQLDALQFPEANRPVVEKLLRPEA
ncbi:(deoxy)nucleoside triphosphate pyrophosphohydrolase [Planctomicrobium piriforme]|uniref:8-oxo-dGTP diphosphatase n=1 Tax=Planctomicrobium piriforme TaxID=1576369 RepID=A0A1I3PGI8_9PLAN|nr:(deoxy)nucleoside triphosphate pyrophosphohydrolase [Planctomicrobium piriforme]SFJ20675.1 8-oxo-dGTP diphosphatase/A/G-specific adenine glycosylase [Planctomicrobium piriforme]